MTMPSVTRQGEGRPAIPVGLDAFTPIAEAWGLSTDDQIRLLGSPARSTLFKWQKEGGALPRDTAERIPHLLAIWKALQILFTTTHRCDAWQRLSNAFCGCVSHLG